MQIGAAKFKAQCLKLLDQLGPDGITVTKHGKPVARVLPHPDEPGRLIASLEDKIVVTGDVLSTGLSWEADDQS